MSDDVVRHQPVTHYLSEILELWGQGRTLKEIGSRYGVSRERIRQVLRANGAPTPLQRLVDRLGERRCGVEGCTSVTQVSYCREVDRWLCATHHARYKAGMSDDVPLRVINKSATACVRCGRLCGPGTGVKRNQGRCPKCHSNWAYHNLEGRKEKVKVWTREWRRKKYNSDPEWRERQKQYHKLWRDARKHVEAEQQDELSRLEAGMG